MGQTKEVPVIRFLSAIADLFRFPLIDGIEHDYIAAAESPAERIRRVRHVKSGMFRRGAFDL